MGLLGRCLPCRKHSRVEPGEEALLSCGAPAEERYHSRDSLTQVLSTGATRLLRSDFLFKWYRATDKPLPKRQDLPECAFLDVASLDNTKPLEIIVVSYCWLSAEHPDPDRYHLETLVRLLELFCRSSYENAKEMWPLGSLNLNKEGLLERGICFGGAHAAVGVFLDWTCLYQNKPWGTRSPEQSLMFKEALKSINLWYAHSKTIVWCLESLPEGLERASYSDSGWTVFERCAAGILTPSDKLVVITAERRAHLLQGRNFHGGPLHHYLELVVDRQHTRSLPLTPECFDALIDTKTFTSGADRDKVVKPKYRQTFREVITNALGLHLRGLGFDDGQARELLDLTAAHCKQIVELDLSCNNIKMPGELTIGSATMAGLRHLNLSGCGRGAAVPFDVAPFAELLQLKQLWLAGAFVSGSVAPLARLDDLEVLWLTGTKVSGDVGVLARLRFLQRLGLGSTFVTGDMTPLAAASFLERLGLNNTQVTGDLAALARMKHMQRLGLGGTRVSGDVASLHSLFNLEVLDLSGAPVCGDVGSLSRLEKITVIELGHTSVYGDVARLASLARLERLDLGSTSVSGDFSPLSCLRFLAEVNFYQTRVSEGWDRMVTGSNTKESDVDGAG